MAGTEEGGGKWQILIKKWQNTVNKWQKGGQLCRS